MEIALKIHNLTNLKQSKEISTKIKRREKRMSSTTSILFIGLCMFITTIAVDGTSQQNELSSIEDYLDFHINNIRMKRQIHNWIHKETTSVRPIAKNERNTTADKLDPSTTIEVNNRSGVANVTQLSMEITKIREENDLINIQIGELRKRNTDLEVMNDKLQYHYTDIRRELERRLKDFSRELAHHREVIFLLESRIALNREIRAYGKQTNRRQ